MRGGQGAHPCGPADPAPPSAPSAPWAPEGPVGPGRPWGPDGLCGGGGSDLGFLAQQRQRSSQGGRCFRTSKKPEIRTSKFLARALALLCEDFRTSKKLIRTSKNPPSAPSAPWVPEGPVGPGRPWGPDGLCGGGGVVRSRFGIFEGRGTYAYCCMKQGVNMALGR